MAKNDEEPKQGSENGAASETSPAGSGGAEASPADANAESGVAKSWALSATTTAQPNTPAQATPVSAAATFNKGSTKGGDAIAIHKAGSQATAMAVGAAAMPSAAAVAAVTRAAGPAIPKGARRPPGAVGRTAANTSGEVLNLA